MKINVIYNKDITGYQKVLAETEDILNSNKIEFLTFELSEMQTYGDFTLVIGGDGTLLKAARFYAKDSTPVLGINIRGLGFLCQSGSNGTESVINAVINNK